VARQESQSDDAHAHTPDERAADYFRLLVQSVKDYAIFMLDPAGQVTTWNTGAERIKGYKADEIIGEHFSRFYLPEAIVKRWPEYALEMARKDGRFEDEGWRLRKDGTSFWANVIITPAYADTGELAGFAKVIRDLTERKRHGEGLQQSEERFRLMPEGVQDYAVCVLDTEGRIASWNAGAEHINGYKGAEIIGQHLSLFYTPEDQRAGKPQQSLDAAAAHGHFEDEGWQLRKDGTGFSANTVMTALRDAHGHLKGYSRITRDKTERRRTEEMLRSVVDHVIEGIITIDSEGTIESFNPAAEKLFGYGASEAIGQNVKMLMPEPYHNQHDAYLRNYLSTGHAKIIGTGREVVGRRRDGSTFPMELAVSEFTLGTRRFFTGIVRDITQRKQAEEELRQAEERMRSVVDHVIDGIITIDDGGKVQSFNPAAEKLFGYGRPEVIGQNVKVLMPEPYFSEHDGYIANYMSTGQRKIIGIGREVVGKRKDGSTFPMELAVSEFRIGLHRFFTGIVRDITQRKQLESELRQRVDDLAEADRQKNEFLAMLAHELRNPLAPMRNALHLMKMPGVSDAILVQAREMMERQMHQLVRLVDDLLDVSRIIRGKIELRKEPVDLAMAVARAVETAHPVIDAHGHELRASLPPQPVYVEGDLIRLAQVVANLLTNAAKYTEQSGYIDVSVEASGHDAVLRVRDTGIGVPSEFLPYIFDLFVQGDRSLARSQGGLGIGLTLVKRLVEMHGGTVCAESAGVGHGSTFTVRLPLWTGAGADVGTGNGIQARATDALRKRILVVDDNVDAAESIAMVLRVGGYDVRCVHDGPSALQAAERYHPEVVVLDIGLPGMSGYDVARHLRRRPQFTRTPIIAVTGYGQDDDRRRSREAGFDAHLTKPVDPNALQAFVAASGDQR
jgi:PAS domain S-box-containing protein